jgi:hypothetical protein
MNPKRLTERFSLLFVTTVAFACSAQTQAIPPPSNAPAQTHAVVPLHQNTGTKPGLHVMLSVGGHAAAPFLLDTGSGGLWVYPNAMGAYTTSSPPVAAENEYHSGLIYDGTVVYTTVGFHDAGVTTATVPVVLVQSASCDPSLTGKDLEGCPAYVSSANCPNVQPGQQDAGILCVEEARKLDGTFGADLEPKPEPSASPTVDLYNVLFAIAPWATTFVVTPTALELGAQSTKGFVMLPMTPFTPSAALPNGARGWQRDVTVCYALGSSLSGQAGCLPTVFDTGASQTVGLQFPVSVKERNTTCGQLVDEHLAFTARQPGAGAMLASFVTGFSENVDAIVVKPSSPPQVNTGLTLYNYDEVLYDAARGYVGLRPLSAIGKLWETKCSPK